MKNAAPQSPSSPFATLALGAGLTDGDAAVVLRPVGSAALAAELLAAVEGIRGVGLARIVRHDGDALELDLATTRPVALASELRTALRRRIVSCSAVAGRFVVVLDGDAARVDASRPRFDHRVASDFDRAMGFDAYAAPAATPRRATASAGRAVPGPLGLRAPASLLPALARPAAPLRPLALAAGR